MNAKFWLTVQPQTAAIIKRFGKQHRIITEAGLNFKLPFIEEVAQVLSLDSQRLVFEVAIQNGELVEVLVKYRVIIAHAKKNIRDFSPDKASLVITQAITAALKPYGAEHILDHSRAQLEKVLMLSLNQLTTNISYEIKFVWIEKFRGISFNH